MIKFINPGDISCPKELVCTPLPLWVNILTCRQSIRGSWSTRLEMKNSLQAPRGQERGSWCCGSSEHRVEALPFLDAASQTSAAAEMLFPARGKRRGGFGTSWPGYPRDGWQRKELQRCLYSIWENNLKKQDLIFGMTS